MLWATVEANLGSWMIKTIMPITETNSKHDWCFEAVEAEVKDRWDPKHPETWTC